MFVPVMKVKELVDEAEMPIRPDPNEAAPGLFNTLNWIFLAICVIGGLCGR